MVSRAVMLQCDLTTSSSEVDMSRVKYCYLLFINSREIKENIGEDFEKNWIFICHNTNILGYQFLMALSAYNIGRSVIFHFPSFLCSLTKKITFYTPIKMLVTRGFQCDPACQQPGQHRLSSVS